MLFRSRLPPPSSARALLLAGRCPPSCPPCEVSVQASCSQCSHGCYYVKASQASRLGQANSLGTALGLLSGGRDCSSAILKEQQKRQLLNVVAIRETIVPQDIAIIPKFLNQCGGVTHGDEVNLLLYDNDARNAHCYPWKLTADGLGKPNRRLVRRSLGEGGRTNRHRGECCNNSKVFGRVRLGCSCAQARKRFLRRLANRLRLACLV